MTRGIYEYLEWMGEQLIADATIRAYCLETFSKPLKVYVGQDEAFLPSENDCPVVIFSAGSRGLTGGDRVKTRSAKITIAIKDEIENKPTANAQGVVTFPGLGMLDEIEDLVAKAINNMASHSSGKYAHQLAEGPDDQIQFPVYKAFLGLSVQLDSDF